MINLWCRDPSSPLVGRDDPVGEGCWAGSRDVYCYCRRGRDSSRTRALPLSESYGQDDPLPRVEGSPSTGLKTGRTLDVVAGEGRRD